MTIAFLVVVFVVTAIRADELTKAKEIAEAREKKDRDEKLFRFTTVTLDNLSGLTRDRVAVGIGGLLLNLRREVGDLTTLANPRIRVRHRQSARILIGDKVPVITTTVGTGGFVSDNVNYLDVGLKLDVEPTVHADDDVGIKVALEVSSLGTPIKTASGTLAYQIGTRNVSTLLRLHDGETQLLAGLISRDERMSASRVPGVGDLPMLGRLFSNQLDSGQRTELVLAITPHIVRGPRRPSPAESEVWVGTDGQPRWRPTPLRGGPPARVPAQAWPGSPGSPGSLNPPSAPAGSASPGSPTSPASFTRLNWKAPRSVRIGQEFEATLRLDTMAAVRGLPLHLLFPPDRLQWLAVGEGEFLRRDGGRQSLTHQVDSARGRAQIAWLRHGASGIVGEGDLLTFRFRALAAGPVSLSAEEVRPVWAGQPAAGVQHAAPWALQVE